MTQLKSSEEEFLSEMLENSEQTVWGFELILEERKGNLWYFFDRMNELGLFDPGKYWSVDSGYSEFGSAYSFRGAMLYLESLAEELSENASEQEIRTLLNCVQGMLRSESLEKLDGYYTCRAIAKILATIPVSLLGDDDLDTIPELIRNGVDGGLIGAEIGEGVLLNSLRSTLENDQDKSVKIIEYCTELTRDDVSGAGSFERNITPVIDQYWLGEILKSIVSNTPDRLYQKILPIFEDRLLFIYGDKESKRTYWRRQAIEDHPQNMNDREVDQLFVVAFRDILNKWLDREKILSVEYVGCLIEIQNGITRRLAIYAIDTHWADLEPVFNVRFDSGWLDTNNLHEMYQLLKHHFKSMIPELQGKIVAAIRSIDVAGDEASELLGKSRQRDWLSAIEGRGNSEADELFQSLISDSRIGPPSDTADFSTYFYSSTGSGPSPFSQSELLQKVENKELVQALNNFVSEKSWRSPNKRALTESLESAVSKNPFRFLEFLPEITNLEHYYQYSVVSGFNRAWEAHAESDSKSNQADDWDAVWSALFNAIEGLIANFDPDSANDEFEDDELLLPRKSWLPRAIGDLIRSGTKKDEHAYSATFLPRSRRIVEDLLEISVSEADEMNDPMSHAINSDKGRVIEAVFYHALRECRVEHERKGSHESAWSHYKAIFDSELSKCKNSNLEFSTLCGAWLPQLMYLSAEWVDENANLIFDLAYEKNFKCATSGIPYTSISPAIYKFLNRNGILLPALRMGLDNDYAEKRLTEYVGFAYIWELESIDNEYFLWMAGNSRLDRFAVIANLYWRIHSEEIEKAQLDRVIDFWAYCLTLEKLDSESGVKLKSELGQLICYVEELTEKELKMLLEVIPSISAKSNTWRFIDELIRLADKNPDGVVELTVACLDRFDFPHDHLNQIETLLEKLSETSIDNKIAVSEIASDLRHLPNIRKLYDRLLISTD